MSMRLLIGSLAMAPALERRTRELMARAAYEIALVQVCQATGLPIAAVRGSGCRPLKLAHARQIAIYLAVTRFNVSRRAVGRVARLSAEATRKACVAVEDWREDPAFEAGIASLEDLMEAA